MDIEGIAMLLAEHNWVISKDNIDELRTLTGYGRTQLTDKRRLLLNGDVPSNVPGRRLRKPCLIFGSVLVCTNTPTRAGGPLAHKKPADHAAFCTRAVPSW